MNITIHNKGITLLDEEKDYAEEKARTLLHRSNSADTKEDIRVKMEIDKESSVSKSDTQFFCAITVDIPGKVLRAESHSGGVYSAIDHAAESMAKQLKKEKEKHIHI